MTVRYATSGVSATPGFDYGDRGGGETSGHVLFPDGVSVAIIEVPILDDNVDEPDETFTVTLSDPSGGATLGATISATVTIEDDDNPPFGAPPNFMAIASGTTDVEASWEPVNDATSYEVWRATSVNGPYSLVATSAGPFVVINGHSANTTYLFKVRAMNGATPSGFSNIDAATTTLFTDVSPSGAKVKAIHITELQTAINAMRAAAGNGSASFTAVTTGTTILAAHITQLRTELNAARTALSLPAITYTDNSRSGVVIKATHITDLRGGVQ